MKEFWVYTGLRIALFLGSLGIVVGIWLLTAGSVPLVWAVVVAFVVSGLGSYFLLNRQREAFARRIGSGAQVASRRLEQMRSKEDAD